MNLVNYRAQLDKEEPSRELFNSLCQAVIEGMWPFDVNSVTLYTDHNASWLDMSGVWTLRITVNLPGFDLECETAFVSNTKIGRAFSDHDAENGRAFACQDIRDRLRYRRTAPIPDNVILGED